MLFTIPLTRPLFVHLLFAPALQNRYYYDFLKKIEIESKRGHFKSRFIGKCVFKARFKYVLSKQDSKVLTSLVAIDTVEIYTFLYYN